ncbi:hypothetical protein CCACVL1_09066 [Corchorus capsularis]|uniref:Uncharacterized protein n=1 Tax=Corchorus capsularis TaxID=210143 RepID=A0A1R3IXY6_COCAP|nr:hypothetical protein CCACVL1_09066 [Corchorus capsularis]
MAQVLFPKPSSIIDFIHGAV